MKFQTLASCQDAPIASRPQVAARSQALKKALSRGPAFGWMRKAQADRPGVNKSADPTQRMDPGERRFQESRESEIDVERLEFATLHFELFPDGLAHRARMLAVKGHLGRLRPRAPLLIGHQHPRPRDRLQDGQMTIARGEYSGGQKDMDEVAHRLPFKARLVPSW